MRIKPFLFPILLACSALGVLYRLRTANAPAHTAPSRRNYATLDAFVEEQMRRLKIPGVALAIVEGEQITHLRGFGRRKSGR